MRIPVYQMSSYFSQRWRLHYCNIGCVPVRFASSRALVLNVLDYYLTGTPKWNGAISNVICYTCALHLVKK